MENTTMEQLSSMMAHVQDMEKKINESDQNISQYIHDYNSCITATALNTNHQQSVDDANRINAVNNKKQTKILDQLMAELQTIKDMKAEMLQLSRKISTDTEN